ncbi:28S ribosomal protein S36, mitochondrial [Latimeria chalumnae]|uniref:Alpha-ketoglutarate dehydrogenase subunit 4 n=1 Tax=Latimeria chalumnae TaxID=7897 RepID=M3XIE2_LATCH|nr:PREDICTED: 28S ribosomal protein S36, mitochondrial [Latimeria chalumnae]|eukprot:XP_006010329.1 PREDICTED: 28S ribosomal protein S36, mitochondrial [Latimeria chalumnae]
MGSKMVAASRVVQAVKPHAPLIRFPDRKGYPRPNVHEALKSVVLPAPSSYAAASGPQGPQTSRLPGTPDTIEIVRALPQKYRRRSVTEEEMEYIQRGGPE